MRRRSERSLVLCFAFFVFCCLLLSGGSRLIAGEGGENAIAVRPAAAVRAVLTSAAPQRAQTGSLPRREISPQRQTRAPAPQSAFRHPCVLHDANGNVLGSMTYLHAVYQAFTLSDGFV